MKATTDDFSNNSATFKHSSQGIPQQYLYFLLDPWRQEIFDIKLVIGKIIIKVQTAYLKVELST